MPFQPCMTFFLLHSTKGDSLMNFLLGEFNTTALHRDCTSTINKAATSVSKKKSNAAR